MPENFIYSHNLRDFVKVQEPHEVLLPRNDPELVEFILDMYETEELQRVDAELRERKRVLEERLTELNTKLRELEALKAQLELERQQLEESCVKMEAHVVYLEGVLQAALQEHECLLSDSTVATVLDLDTNGSSDVTAQAN